MKIAELFENIRTTSGASAKAEIMQKNLTPVITEIFKDCYDNSVKYFVKKFNMPTTEGDYTLEKNYDKFHKMLGYLASRQITGGDAIALVEDMISKFVAADQPWLAAIMDRNLKIGLSKETFAKLVGTDVAKKFEVTLAINLDNAKGVNPIDGTFYASRKCDGTRCVGLCHKENGQTTVKFMSRGNKEFTTLDKVKPAIAWYLRDLPDGDYVTDGELCKVDKNGDEDFQAIMKEIKRKDYTIPDPCYQMFDFCTQAEFDGKAVSANFTGRYAQMQKMMKGNKNPEIKLLKQELIKSQEDFDRWSGYVEAGNWEGFMLRKDIPFEVGRSKNLLKVKKFDDMEAVVKRVEISEMTTAEPGIGNVTYTGVKALIIDYKGNEVHVGTGLTKDQRIAWYKNEKLIIGKTICVKYFEETKSQNGTYSLRFPILKYVYENGRGDL